MAKRVYRKKEGRPDPSKSPTTEFNRTSKKLNIRVAPELHEAIKQLAKKMKIHQTEALDQAIREKLERERVEVPAPVKENN